MNLDKMRYPIRKRWVWSITMTVVIVLSIVLVFNSVAIDILDTEILNAHKTATDFLRQGVDRRLMELEHVSIQLELDNQNLSLRHATDRSAFSSSETYEFTELFNNAKLANEFIDDIFIYYPAFDYVVGCRGSFTSKGYYLLSNELKDSHYEEWLSSIMETKGRNFIIEVHEEKDPILYYRHESLPSREGKEDAILIAQVNRDAMLRYSSLAVSNQPRTMLTVMGDSGTIYASCGDTSLNDTLLQLLHEDFVDSLTPVSLDLNGYTAMAARSEHTGISYLILSDTKTILATPRRIACFSYLMIFLCLVIGIILSLVIGKKQSRPLEKLAGRLNASSNALERLDYDSIEKRVDSILQENREAIQLNLEQGWILRDRFLNEVITTAQEDQGLILSMAAYFGISFDYIHFRLIVMYPEEIGDGQNIPTAERCMRRTAEELEKDNSALAIPALINGNLVILLNYENSNGVDADALADQVEALLEKKLRIFVGDEFDTEVQIVFSYEKALNQLDLSLRGSDLGKKGGYPPVHKEWMEGKVLHAQWQKNLRLKEYAQAAEMCGQLFSGYVFADGDPYSARSRKYTVINDLLECAEEENLRHGTLSRKDAEIALQACGSSTELTDCIKCLLERLEAANESYVESQQDSLAWKIRKIIDENYAQSYLGLYYIADIVKVSSSYVSKIFKKEYQIGITDYINQLRITKAKELMAEGKPNIKDIAVQVGFNSDIHFIRVFKKYESTTPGAYRKMDKEN